jgi:poly(ADP-ribose) glycohydrolase
VFDASPSDDALTLLDEGRPTGGKGEAHEAAGKAEAAAQPVPPVRPALAPAPAAVALAPAELLAPLGVEGEAAFRGEAREDVLQLPHHAGWGELWTHTVSLLLRPVDDSLGFLRLLRELHALWRLRGFSYRGAWDLLEAHLSAEERARFFRHTLPGICKCVLQLPELFPSPEVALMPRGVRGLVRLTRRQIAALLSCGFLCILHRRAGPRRGGYFRSANFVGLFRMNCETHAQKLRCLLAYFERVVTTQPSGSVAFVRHVVDPRALPPLRECALPLCAVEFEARGNIEDSAYDSLHADFANRHIGGGALGQGCVQEEILFVIKPECIAAMALCEGMEPNEAIYIRGACRYASYSGYGRTFRFVAPYAEPTERAGCDDDAFAVDCCVTAFDALELQDEESAAEQFSVRLMKREIVKAFAAFSGDERELRGRYPAVATGNWGCGAFGGDVQLKILLQWIAASLAGRHMRYFAFENEECRDFPALRDALLARGVTVGSLWMALTDFAYKSDPAERRRRLFRHVATLLKLQGAPAAP